MGGEAFKAQVHHADPVGLALPSHRKCQSQKKCIKQVK